MSSPQLNPQAVLRSAASELERLREQGDGAGFSALCRRLEQDQPEFFAEMCLSSLNSKRRRDWLETPGLDFRPSFRWGGVSVRIREEVAIDPILESWRARDLKITALRLEGVDPSCMMGMVEAELLVFLRELAIEGCGLASRGSAYPVSERVLQVSLSGHEQVLRALVGLEALRVLRLADNRLGNRGLQSLRGFYQLHGLELRGNAVSDAGLEALSSLTGLQRLGLGKNRIEGPGLSGLSHLKSLRRLDLHGNPLSDLTALSQISGLMRLNLEDCSIASDELKALQLCLGSCELRVS